MILFPTRKRLQRRRNDLYDHLYSILEHASVRQVEETMRKIHIINFKLRSYFVKEGQHEAEELFED